MSSPSSTENDFAIVRKVNPWITTFSTSFMRFKIIPFGGRTTAVRLNSGSYLIFCSTPLTPLTKSTLSDIPVKYIVAPDLVHWLYIEEWVRQYPEAKVYGVQGLTGKQDWSKKGVKWDGLFGTKTPDGNWPEELKEEVKVEYFKGFANKDLALLHVPSKTMMEADLLCNMPAHEQFSQSSIDATPWYLPVSYLSPGSWLSRTLLRTLSIDKPAMIASVGRVANWDFETIITCHGDVIEKDAKKAWTSSYASFMKAWEDKKAKGE